MNGDRPGLLLASDRRLSRRGVTSLLPFRKDDELVQATVGQATARKERWTVVVGVGLGALEINGMASPLDRIETLTLDWRFLLAGARPAPASRRDRGD